MPEYRKILALILIAFAMTLTGAARAGTGYMCGEKMLVFVDDSQSLAYLPIEGKRLNYCAIMREMIESNIQCTSSITPQSISLRIFAPRSGSDGSAKTITTIIDRIAMRGTIKAAGAADVTENCQLITEAEFASRSNNSSEEVNFDIFQDDVPGKGYEVTINNNDNFDIRCTINVKGVRQEGSARFPVDLSSVISVSPHSSNSQSWRGISSSMVESSASCEAQ